MTSFFLKRTACLLAAIALHTTAEALIGSIPVPPGTILEGNSLRVDEYIDSLIILPGSDLEGSIKHLPLESEGFVHALDQLHPALLQDISFATDQNMQAFRQMLTGRNAFLRHRQCVKFRGLYSDNCNIGPHQFWITPFGVFNNQAHIGDLHGYRSTTPGIMMGIDSQPNKCSNVGFGLGYSFTDLHWKKAYGNAAWHTGYFGAYASTIYDCFYLDGSVLGSYEFYKTKRKIRYSKFECLFNDFYCDRLEDCCDEGEDCCSGCNSCFPASDSCSPNKKCGKGFKRKPPCGIHRSARNRYRGYAILSHIGLGFNFNLAGMQLIPFASIDYDFVDQDGHREYGARSLNLRVKANHSHLLRTEFGLSAIGCIPYNCGWFRPSATVSFVRKSVLHGEKFNSSFVHYGCQGNYNARGTRKTLDLVAPGFGLQMQFSSMWIMSFNYEAELNKEHTSQWVTCLIKRTF